MTNSHSTLPAIATDLRRLATELDQALSDLTTAEAAIPFEDRDGDPTHEHILDLLSWTQARVENVTGSLPSLAWYFTPLSDVLDRHDPTPPATMPAVATVVESSPALRIVGPREPVLSCAQALRNARQAVAA